MEPLSVIAYIPRSGVRNVVHDQAKLMRPLGDPDSGKDEVFLHLGRTGDILPVQLQMKGGWDRIGVVDRMEAILPNKDQVDGRTGRLHLEVIGTGPGAVHCVTEPLGGLQDPSYWCVH